MSDLAETISVKRDGLRDRLEGVAVSRETDAKVKGTVPPMGALRGRRDRTGVTDARRRRAFTNPGL